MIHSWIMHTFTNVEYKKSSNYHMLFCEDSLRPQQLRNEVVSRLYFLSSVFPTFLEASPAPYKRDLTDLQDNMVEEDDALK